MGAVGLFVPPSTEFARLVEKTDIHVGREFFSFTPNSPWEWSGRFWRNSFLFDCDSRFCLLVRLAASLFSASITSGSLLTHAVGRWARRQEHFHGILIAKQALGKHAVETFNDSLISVNFSAPTADGCFVTFRFFGHISHEHVARINLQQLSPSQWAGLVSRLKNLRNFGRVFWGQGSASL